MYTSIGVVENSQALARKYQYLSSLSTLSPTQKEYLSHILSLAIHDPALDELIQKIELADLSPNDIHTIFDQQAKIREYLGVRQNNFCHLISQ